ncbi:hypothetical protein EJB05_10713, partial [Eragrostis curvula]
MQGKPAPADDPIEPHRSRPRAMDDDNLVYNTPHLISFNMHDHFADRDGGTNQMSSMMTMASSSLNPNAPIFVPAAYRQVEDYSPEWWELVKTTAWFRDHWVSQHQLLEAQYDAAAMPEADALDLLDTDDLFYSPDNHHHQPQEADVLRSLTLNPPATITSPRGALWDHHYQQPRHADKPAQQHVGLKAGARRVIHQPR